MRIKLTKLFSGRWLAEAASGGTHEFDHACDIRTKPRELRGTKITIESVCVMFGVRHSLNLKRCLKDAGDYVIIEDDSGFFLKHARAMRTPNTNKRRRVKRGVLDERSRR